MVHTHARGHRAGTTRTEGRNEAALFTAHLARCAMSSSFFRGTSGASDPRFADKAAAALKSIGASAPAEYATRISMSKVYRPLIESWVAQRITQMLGFEDDLVIGTVQALLSKESPDPRELQMYLTGFLEKQAQAFVVELWGVLISAQASKTGECARSPRVLRAAGARLAESSFDRSAASNLVERERICFSFGRAWETVGRM